jgi:hypothetical protein
MASDGSDERRAVCEVLHRALVEIRLVASQGHAPQAADLADAIHNLPLFMDAGMDWALVRHSLEAYQRKYPRHGNDAYFDYVALVEAGREGAK